MARPGQLWHERTGLPWVAAVWAVRPEALTDVTAQQVITDLNASRDAGLQHIEELVAAMDAATGDLAGDDSDIFKHNIHYTLDDDCLRAIRLFRELAAGIGALPALPELNLL